MNATIVDLKDCGEAATILAGRPAGAARWTIRATALLLASALAWAWVTPVKLVAVAPGRVRPAGAPLEGEDGPSGRAVCAPWSGRVLAVGCREGERVRSGQALARLDTAKQDAEIARLERTIAADEAEAARLDALGGTLDEQEAAALERLERAVAEAGEGVAGARARREREEERGRDDVRIAELAWERAREQEARVRALVEARVEARQRLAEAEGARRDAEARRDAARRAAAPSDADVRLAERRRETAAAEGAVVRRDFAARREEVRLRADGKRAAAAAARATVDGLRHEVEAAVLVAPLDGVVTESAVREGDVLEAGRAFATIAPETGFRVDARVAAADAAGLRVGLPARVKLDAYDWLEYGALTGTVEYVSPDAEPQENGPAAYRVRLRLDADHVGRGERRGALRLGLTGTVELVLGEERLAKLLVQKVREEVRF